MRILVYTANLGSFDDPQVNAEQDIEFDYRQVTDREFPPRFNAMTPRLQARLVKMFGWQMFPGYDIYLWVDSSCRLARKDSLKWFVEALGDGDIAVFKHPTRNTIQEEADYLRERLELERTGKKQKYVLPRYDNEDIDGALSEVDPEARLYASTAFIYRNSSRTQTALKEWWYQTSRYHLIDQLGFSYAIEDLMTTVINKDYMRCAYLEFTR